jgi:hypothetical protein
MVVISLLRLDVGERMERAITALHPACSRVRRDCRATAGAPVDDAVMNANVDKLLAAISSGAGSAVADLYADDAVLDATVPGWRFSRRGAAAIAAEYAGWFADPGRFEELDRVAVPGGEIVTFLLTWEERGVPHAAHQCHQLSVDGAGRISADRAFCGGRWDATLLASMEAAEHAH